MIFTTLAADNNIVVPFAIVIVLIQAGMGMVLWTIKRSVSRVDKLEEDVKQYASEIIETKHSQVLSAIERIEARLSDGDRRFSKLNQHDHQAELQLVRSFEELRRYVVENCAKAEEQVEFRKELEGLKLAVTRLQEKEAA